MSIQEREHLSQDLLQLACVSRRESIFQRFSDLSLSISERERAPSNRYLRLSIQDREHLSKTLSHQSKYLREREHLSNLVTSVQISKREHLIIINLFIPESGCFRQRASDTNFLSQVCLFVKNDTFSKNLS